jgi:hypothetical protein
MFIPSLHEASAIMLITFHSKSAAEVLMLSTHAGPLLHAAGKIFAGEIPQRGVFTPEQLQTAIDGLNRAIAQAPNVHEEQDEDAPPVHAMAQPVGLAQRAYPLLDMLRKAQADNNNVTWEATSGL